MTEKYYINDETGKNTHVMLTLSEYDALVEDSEMLRDVREFKQALDDVDEVITSEVVDRLVNKENPIAVWREYRNLKSNKLAKMSGLTPSYLSMIEAGKREPSVKSLKAIAKSLNVDIDDLI